jgi:hypothetical protein
MNIFQFSYLPILRYFPCLAALRHIYCARAEIVQRDRYSPVPLHRRVSMNHPSQRTELVNSNKPSVARADDLAVEAQEVVHGEVEARDGSGEVERWE